MKFLKSFLILLVVALVSLCSGCTKVSVHVENAKMVKKPFLYENKIKIEANQIMPITPTVSGKIVSGKPDIGQRVKAGDILFEIDSSSYKAELLKLSEKHSNSSIVKEDDIPSLSLLKQGIITRAEYEKLIQKKGLVHSNTSNYDYTSQSSLNVIEKIIESCTIRAPIDGVISEIYIGQDQMAISGKPSLVIRQDSSVCAEITLPENIGAELEESDKLNELTVKLVDGERTLNGKFKAYRLANGNKAYKAEFDNHDGKLKIGEEYTVRIESKREIPCYVLPSKSLINEDSVAIVTENGLVDFKTVKVIYNDGKNIIIIDGLNDGDRIITNPPKKLEIGTEIDEV